MAAAEVRPADRVAFAHNAERQFALLLDFYGVAWAYEPRTFVLARHPDGSIAEAFSPDFHLTELDRYVELTTQRQALVTRKNRKVRRLRELHPDIDIAVVYQRDYLHLLARFGLDAPDQHGASAPATPAFDPSPSLLATAPAAPIHPSSPAFRHAG